MLNNEYCKRVYEQILARDPDQKEFHQAVYEVLEGLEPMVERRPELEKNGILERFVEPERVVTFRVPWTDDAGQVHVNRGYRVPRAVQLRHRPLQGRPAVPPHGEPVHPEILRL